MSYARLPPASSLEIVDCEKPDNAPSSPWCRPCARRAIATTAPGETVAASLTCHDVQNDGGSGGRRRPSGVVAFRPAMSPADDPSTCSIYAPPWSDLATP